MWILNSELTFQMSKSCIYYYRVVSENTDCKITELSFYQILIFFPLGLVDL